MKKKVSSQDEILEDKQWKLTSPNALGFCLLQDVGCYNEKNETINDYESWRGTWTGSTFLNEASDTILLLPQYRPIS